MRLDSVWLAGNAEISELERDRDFRFAAVDSVCHGGWTIQEILDQAPSGFRYYRGQKI
jgi:hypothetical protein